MRGLEVGIDECGWRLIEPQDTRGPLSRSKGRYPRRPRVLQSTQTDMETTKRGVVSSSRNNKYDEKWAPQSSNCRGPDRLELTVEELVEGLCEESMDVRRKREIGGRNTY